MKTASDFAPTIPAQRGVADPGYARLWSIFMTARAVFAAALLLLHSALRFAASVTPLWIWWLSAFYLVIAVLARWRIKPRGRMRLLGGQWMVAVGVDMAFFMALLLTQRGAINYTPLFALPVLIASVLGSRLLAVGSAALVTVLLFGHGVLTGGAPDLAQVSVVSAGLLALAWLTNVLSARLSHEEARARASRAEARMQEVVNSMVIEGLPDGVLVIDSDHVVRAANPAAHIMLGYENEILPRTFSIDGNPAWFQLALLARRTLAEGAMDAVEITLRHADGQFSHLQVRTQRTPAPGGLARPLCVMFMQDLREMEARLRTEKLASMGRISAAVAHEIRNPLAAISQANALLTEDLQQPIHQKLTGMVRQNAERLGHIVDDVLEAVRVEPPAEGVSLRESVALDALAAIICADWIAQQDQAARRVLRDWGAPATHVRFNAEHLRRVLVNLLDNAARYASGQPAAIQVATHAAEHGNVTLLVWSDGAAMEPSVRRHLFEPFFSSESRSSGLGLFICRELCQRHGAEIAYARTQRVQGGSMAEGNEFFIGLQRMPAPGTRPLP
ncbi:MAG: PAS domain-containing protein [Burkholderiaceae bacterium]|jgi:two-component system sensor histidine kinase PilS (NtrC family)|nr:PAS domain-containing protein [Burkholderiaceae bacterium]